MTNKKQNKEVKSGNVKMDKPFSVNIVLVFVPKNEEGSVIVQSLDFKNTRGIVKDSSITIIILVTEDNGNHKASSPFLTCFT